MPTSLAPHLRVQSLHSGSIVATSVDTGRGHVTQLTDSGTGVELNTSSGVITTVTLSTAAQTVEGSFTVTNSQCSVNSVVLLSAGGEIAGTPYARVVAIDSGSFDVEVMNINPAGGNSFDGPVDVHFMLV